MRVNRIERITPLYNSLHKRPYYKEEDSKKKEEEQYKELKERMEDFQSHLERFKERMEDFQSHLERFKEETKDNLYGKEGVDLEEVQRLFRRNE